MRLAFPKSFKDEFGDTVQRITIDDWDVTQRGFIVTTQAEGMRRLFNHLDEQIECLAYLLPMTELQFNEADINGELRGQFTATEISVAMTLQNASHLSTGHAYWLIAENVRSHTSRP